MGGDPAPREGGLDARFAEETAGLLRSRSWITSAIFLLFVGVVVWLEIRAHPERFGAALGVYAAEVGTCALAMGLAHATRRAGAVTLFCLSFACALCFYLMLYTLLTGLELVVLAMGLLCWMTVVAVLLPWGGVPQAIVCASAFAGYWLALRYQAPLVNPMYAELALFATSTACIIGAAMLQSYRRTAFVRAAQAVEASTAEREKSDALGALLEVDGLLARHLGGRDVFVEILGLLRRAVGCDVVSLFVYDPRREAYLLEASHGLRPQVRADLDRLEWPPSGLPIGRDFVPSRQVEVPDTSLDERVPIDLWRRFETSSALFSPIVRHGEMAGILECSYRRRTGPFDTRARRLAQGIAASLGVALENRMLIDDLKSASRVKTDFLSTMSHELRTPLNAIIGYGDLLAEGAFGPLDPGQEDAVARVRRSARQLFDLVTATLDMGRFESGRETISVDRVDVGDLLREVEQEVDQRTSGETTELRWRNRVATVIYTDRHKIKTILRNLVGNAVKFTPEGTVEVSAHLDEARLVLTVRDTGIGIPAEELPAIFEMFRQADSSSTRRFEGVGLGLFIVNHLVDFLGGTIDVASTVGVGTTFMVKIPVAVQAVAGASA